MASTIRAGRLLRPLHISPFFRKSANFSTFHSPNHPESVDVAIIGGGTVGKCLSVMLARFGVDSIVIEQNSRKSQKGQPGDPNPVTAHPRAHVLHTRSMEIMRELGLDERIHRMAPPLSQWRHFRYLETMLGTELGSVDFFKGQTARWLRMASPAALSHLSQPLLDSILDDLTERSGKCENFPGKVHYLQGYQGESFGIHGDGHVSVALAKNPGITEAGGESPEISRRVTCQFLIAAEGANSRIRRTLGVELEGKESLQHFVSVHFTCRELWSRLRELRRPGMLHFVFSQDAIGVLVAHNLQRGEWVAQFPFYPPHQKPEDMTKPALCEHMIRSCIGLDYGGRGMKLKIHSADAWRMNGLVATEFTDKKRKVFLVGDSAHQFPPSGGFGLNAGIQDAHNIAWKLASVIHGTASKDILSSYTPERRKVCRELRDLSIDNFHRGLLVPEALGLPPNIPNLISEALESKAVNFIPESARRTLLETMLGVGRRLNPVLSPPVMSFFKAESLKKLHEVLEKHRSLPLLFPHHDLGLEYTAPGSLTRGGRPKPRPRYVEGVQQYQPRLCPGARFPHFWLTPGPPPKRTPASALAVSHASPHAPISSVDVASTLSISTKTRTPRWVLFHDSDSEETKFTLPKCLAEVGIHTGAQAGGAGLNNDFSDRKSDLFRTVAALFVGKDHGTRKLRVVWDAEGSWRALVKEAGGADVGEFCVLVRPDGIVAWCGGAVSDAVKAYDQLVGTKSTRS